MSLSLKANAAGTQGELLLNGVPALQIDSLTSTIKALAPYLLVGTEVVSNANGVAIKFPDGTMICVTSSSVVSGAWTPTTPAGGAFANFGGLNNYPVPFVGSLPRVMAWGNEQDISARSAYVSNVTTTLNGVTGGFFSSPCVPTNQAATTITALAVGRWKT